MADYFGLFITVWLKFSFLFTPFLALTIMLNMTQDQTEVARRKLSIRVTVAVALLSVGVFFFGNVAFRLFGITLDSFRVGAGVLLFLSAIELVRSTPGASRPGKATDEDIAVVPLAMPIVIGPAIIGTLLVLGADLSDTLSKAVGICALMLATLTLGCILWIGTFLERALGRKNLNTISRMTGLILAALAAQMIMTGIRNFFA
jgi:multiple antibiotic resistance protein